jgi:hypothetical protein
VDERPDTPPACRTTGDLAALLLSLRQARIIEIAAIERFLGLAPSRTRRGRPEKVRAWHNEDEGEYKTA